jgi:ferric-dicitrate binding protein FerR (iron transport regulator)
MMKVNDPLDWDRLRGDIADVQRPHAEGEDTLRKARARFLLTAKGRPRLRRSRRWPIYGAIAAAACIAVGIGLRFRAEGPLRFDTGAQHASGELGVLLTATTADPLPIHFSDGTLLSMASTSRARVTETSSRGATVVLEEGSISASVVHRKASSWHVAAGPFTVLVTGTKFDVRWNAAEQALALDLHEGAVTVLGPTLGVSGRRVSPGESIRVSAVARTEAPPSTPPVDQPADTTAGHDDAAKPAPGDPGSRSSWKQLALTEHYADALAAAEAENFDALCRRASAADLLLLANTARFAGSAPRAQQAFRAVRTRFAGTHEAAMAAFTLGRIAYDDRHAYREAAQWFQSYLQDEPSGGLATVAAGRLMEAYRAAGDTVAARAAAQSYLSKYPAGPHATLARSIVNR